MIEVIRKRLLILEAKHFNIINSYIRGIVKIEEVKDFGEYLEQLRSLLDSFITNEENLLEIAKYKSKVQHYYTEIMEDSDLLSVAYNNNL